MRNTNDFLVAAAFLCAATLLSSCGGGGSGYSPPPAPTIISVTVSCSPTTIATGATSQCTATVMGTGGFSPAVSWTSSKTAVATVDSSGKVTAVTAGAATITATSTQDPSKSGTASVTVVAPLSVSVSASATTVNTGAAITLSATVTGGTGSAAVAWSAPARTFSPAAGLTTTYTAPGTVPSPATVVITATATDPTGSATATANVTVQRVITISLDPSVNIPNGEIYSDFGTTVGLTINCTGCETGDILNIGQYFGSTQTYPYPGSSWTQLYLNFTGIAYLPRPIKIWATGTDGVSSNALRFAFTGSQNVAVQDPSSGEMYYYFSGNGTSGSGAILKFKPDGTSDGSCTGNHTGAATISLDNQTNYVVLAGDTGGTGQYDSNCNSKGSGYYVAGVSPPALALDAHDGLACTAYPEVDAAYCYYVQQAATNDNNPNMFAIPGIPTGSQPAAIKVFDATHIVLYGRGDQTLRWYTISGTTATAAGTLALSEFTPTDANYWNAHPVTGGWYLAAVGGTLGVMGQVVNADGTVSQKLALVNNTNQTLTHDVSLPGGTIRIAPDPTNNAVLAEDVDFSGGVPITRFARVYVDTGNVVQLTSTSNLVPGAGVLVTNDGSHIAVFVQAQADLQPNQ